MPMLFISVVQSSIDKSDIKVSLRDYGHEDSPLRGGLRPLARIPVKLVMLAPVRGTTKALGGR